MRFRYRSGEKPLDGYTLRRGLGKGGFGEVYLAYSDGGKEVALKLISGHTAIELRGIAHCLNLKHPNLVHLYDLRYDKQGNPWLVMEFILGESLGQIVQRSPSGLPEQMVREWFLSFALGLNHLHDRGIVHRDLKPGNVFIENGHLKIGDYGLCKMMTESGVGHSSNMGTVHYMAPEISRGDYSRSIDIYASGIMLYEMLLGRVPFNGQSMGEIMIKHVTETPDLSMIPLAYQPILRIALAKSPDNRYGTIAEMAQAVDELRSPLNLKQPPPTPQRVESLVVKPTPEVILHGPVEPPYRPVPSPPPRSNPPLPSNVVPEIAQLPPPSLPEKMEELARSMIAVPILMLPVVGISMLSNHGVDPWGCCRFGMLTTLFIWSILIITKIGSAPVAWHRYALAFIGACIGGLHLWSSGWTPTYNTLVNESGAWTAYLQPIGYFALAMAIPNWSDWVNRTRETYWSVWPVIITAGLGWGLWLFWRDAPISIPWMLPIAAGVIPFVSPWRPLPTPSNSRKLILRSGHTPIPSDTYEEYGNEMSVPSSSGD